MNEFDCALAGLYAAFEGPAPKEIFGCYHCLDQPQRNSLLEKPLGVLTSEDLSQYAMSLFSTVGGVDDYRYFLPRIFDLSATDIRGGPSPEIALGALTEAEWGGWSVQEREAIETFLRTWLDRWAAESLIEIRWNEIDSLLCGVARAGLKLKPYLERLLAPSNLLGLRELVALNREAAAKGAAPENFWEYSPEGWSDLMDFLTSDAVRERLATA